MQRKQKVAGPMRAVGPLYGRAPQRSMSERREFELLLNCAKKIKFSIDSAKPVLMVDLPYERAKFTIH